MTQGALELGPFLRPNVATTLTKRLLYCILLLALPVFFFFFSWGSTYTHTHKPNKESFITKTKPKAQHITTGT